MLIVFLTKVIQNAFIPEHHKLSGDKLGYISYLHFSNRLMPLAAQEQCHMVADTWMCSLKPQTFFVKSCGTLLLQCCVDNKVQQLHTDGYVACTLTACYK